MHKLSGSEQAFLATTAQVMPVLLLVVLLDPRWRSSGRERIKHGHVYGKVLVSAYMISLAVAEFLCLDALYSGKSDTAHLLLVKLLGALAVGVLMGGYIAQLWLDEPQESKN